MEISTIILKAIFFITGIASVIATFTFAILSFFKPKVIAQIYKNVGRESDGHSIKSKIFLGLTALGFGVMLYGAIDNALWFIPEHLRFRNQDGEWESYKNAFSLMVLVVVFIPAGYVFGDLHAMRIQKENLIKEINIYDEFAQMSECQRAALRERIANARAENMKGLKIPIFVVTHEKATILERFKISKKT